LILKGQIFFDGEKYFLWSFIQVLFQTA
jgi:hypothetical protein